MSEQQHLITTTLTAVIPALREARRNKAANQLARIANAAQAEMTQDDADEWDDSFSDGVRTGDEVDVVEGTGELVEEDAPQPEPEPETPPEATGAPMSAEEVESTAVRVQECEGLDEAEREAMAEADADAAALPPEAQPECSGDTPQRQADGGEFGEVAVGEVTDAEVKALQEGEVDDDPGEPPPPLPEGEPDQAVEERTAAAVLQEIGVKLQEVLGTFNEEPEVRKAAELLIEKTRRP